MSYPEPQYVMKIAMDWAPFFTAKYDFHGGGWTGLDEGVEKPVPKYYPREEVGTKNVEQAWNTMRGWFTMGNPYGIVTKVVATPQGVVGYWCSSSGHICLYVLKEDIEKLGPTKFAVLSDDERRGYYHTEEYKEIQDEGYIIDHEVDPEDWKYGPPKPKSLKYAGFYKRDGD